MREAASSAAPIAKDGVESDGVESARIALDRLVAPRGAIPMGTATILRLCEITASKRRVSASERQEAAIFTASPPQRRRRRTSRGTRGGRRWKSCAETSIWAGDSAARSFLEPNRSAVSISTSHHKHPARTACARMAISSSTVPANWPPARRVLHVAISMGSCRCGEGRIDWAGGREAV